LGERCASRKRKKLGIAYLPSDDLVDFKVGVQAKKGLLMWCFRQKVPLD